jgi:hypothetical protein
VLYELRETGNPPAALFDLNKKEGSDEENSRASGTCGDIAHGR